MLIRATLWRLENGCHAWLAPSSRRSFPIHISNPMISVARITKEPRNRESANFDSPVRNPKTKLASLCMSTRVTKYSWSQPHGKACEEHGSYCGGEEGE